jgi:hypothetical protein
MQTDLKYFLKRASEERTAALQVRNPNARHAHVELAERYEERVRRLAARQEPRLFFAKRSEP